MSRRSPALAALPLLALVALTGCTPGGDAAPGSGTASDDPASADGDALGPVLTECVNGDWNADLDDLASQLGSHMGSSGLAVTGSTASGTQQLSIAGEGVLGFANDMTFTLTIDMSGGLVMTVTQTHTGQVGADWAWDGGAEASDTAGTMSFSNFQDASYAVDTTVAINGEASDAPISMPPMAAGDVPLEVTCTGDTLTTHPTGSPFTTTWHRG